MVSWASWKACIFPWGAIVTVATTVGGYLLAFLLIPRILLQKREPSATLLWIVIIALLPYLGALFFFAFGRSRVRRRARKHSLAHRALAAGPTQPPHRLASCEMKAADPQVPEISRHIARVAACLNETAPLRGNREELFLDAAVAYRRMEESIAAARHHVHMMSYIFRPDQTGARFRDLLAEKARRGVEVRLLVDAVGSYRMKRTFVSPLVAAGAKFARFMPVFPPRPQWRPILRNHRKILVVDGRLGFAGGLNIGDEYQGRKKKYAPWRDTHMLVEGPAVWRLQEVFADDWYFATDEDLIKEKYFPEIPPAGDELVQVVESGPDQPYETIHAVFFSAIASAKERVYITTPYFVPDPAILTALKSASLRGVDVRILLPGKSDLKLVMMAGRSYYQELLQAGVKLYQHRPGILHAKTMVVDGAWATVGSANMDIRSFRLNFEANILVYGTKFAKRMEEIFLNDIAAAAEITFESIKHKSRRILLAESICRILSPVL